LEVFDCLAPNVVYVKGRRAGGTMGAALRLVELARERPGSQHLWIDTVHRNIGRYVRRYLLPQLQPGEGKWRATGQTLEFSNGSRCDFGSAQMPENLEGFGYEFLWINEAGIVLKDEDLYHHTVRPMLLDAKTSQSFFVGAPKGRGLFQRLYLRGQDGAETEWRTFHHPSQRNPRLNAALLEEFRRDMPEQVYRQEILAEFTADAGQVFRDPERLPEAEWEARPRPGGEYVLGVDLARYADFTVVWVGRADKQAAVYCERFHRIGWAQQVARIAALSKRFGNAPAFVDSTGVGDPICDELARAGVSVHPVNFSAGRKAYMIELLAQAFEQDALRIAPHEQTRRELAVFEYQRLPSGRLRLAAPAGQHDDCVIALALCHFGLGRPKGGLILGPRLISDDDEI
jgi:hypothetical protein